MFNYFSGDFPREIYFIIMKYLFSFLSILLYFNPVKGQKSFLEVTVDDFGCLEQAIGDRWDKIDSLIIHGPIDSIDFKTIWQCAFDGKLTVLNLADAQVKNKQIPPFALYNPRRQWADSQVLYTPLQKIILPEDIIEIGRFAFKRMRLETINLPKTLKKLNRESFASCHWLRFNPLVIPEGLTEIPFGAFMHCQSFDELVLPSTIKILAGFCFYNTRMSKANFPQGLERIEQSAFEGSGELKQISLPQSVQHIGYNAFSFADSLREINIPEGITIIPACFLQCARVLEHVNIPKSVVKIESSAFMDCEKLKNIELPSGLKEIGLQSFWYCKNIENLIIPASVEKIGEKAFAYWENLKSLYSLSPIPPICHENAFKERFTPIDKTTLYVPVGSIDMYRQATGWNCFTNMVETDHFPTCITPCMAPSSLMEVKIYVEAGNINIINMTNHLHELLVSVYNMNGQTVWKGVLYDQLQISLNKGMYLIRTGMTTHKIII